jgi:acetoin utilization deacetylase AcuC-like enzyme
MRVGLIYDPFFARHDTGPTHPERPERLQAIIDALSSANLLERMQTIQVRSAGTDILAWVHEPAYIELVRLASEQGMTFLGSRDTNICPESYEVARRAAGGALAACDAVMAGEVSRAFCAVRPPGHHAGTDQAAGYCLFNNVALAAQYLIRRHHLTRVAIVDWDVHHGNGTQDIFENRPDVLYISLHEKPQLLYPHTGYAHETGTGPGAGHTLNVPMPPGSGDAEYRQAFAERIIPSLDGFAPEFVLISAGFDAAGADRTADINLTPESFTWMTRDLIAIADRHGHGRLVSVLEGGYDLVSLGRCVVAHVRAMMNNP